MATGSVTGTSHNSSAGVMMSVGLLAAGDEQRLRALYRADTEKLAQLAPDMPALRVFTEISP